MPHSKSLKTLFVETILFICLFALVGHLSVNFWERYVIQSELTKMKSSLHSLKDTINNIGVAYDHLHKELRDLAEIAEKSSTIDPLRQKAPDKLNSKNKILSLTEIFRSKPIQAVVSTAEMRINAKPLTEDKSQICEPPRALVKTTSTFTKTPFVDNPDKKTETSHWTSIDKTTQCVRNAKPIDRKSVNASTLTRYPRRSTGIGNRSIHNGTCILHQNYKFADKFSERKLQKQIYEILTGSPNLTASNLQNNN